MFQRIDAISQFDISSLSYQDIRWRYGTGIDQSTGKGYYKVVKYRNGVMTNIGDIELSVWLELAYKVIEAHGDLVLLTQMTEYLREYGLSSRGKSRTFEKELKQEALQHCASQLHDNPEWVNFLQFNQEYRPEILKSAHIVKVNIACCQQTVEVT